MARLLLLGLGFAVCAVAGLLLYQRYEAAVARATLVLEEGAPELNAVERLVLQNRLARRVDALQQPLGVGTRTATFVVEPGQTARGVAENLAAQNLLPDVELFLDYLRYYGLDAQIEAGRYTIDPRLTIPQLAVKLTNAAGEDLTLRFLEGWRLEEMIDYLATVRPGAIDPDAFAALARRERALDLTPYPALTALPAGATLEGFLFPDTYRVSAEATAEELIHLMLANFEQKVPATTRAGYAAHGLNLYEAVTLAAIIEREALLAAERPVLAGVFYNRLRQGIKLQADPTVQYAAGYDAATGSWWKSPLFQADLDRDSPYNTYLYAGLPPGPIANPSRSALLAVGEPADHNYIFFVADCLAADGSHLFSTTYDQHLAYVQRCR